MTGHLLLITLGPVQDFIAQARRTRDLWYGSHLLSELSRAAARALDKGGAQLIFPSIEEGELDGCLAPLRPNNAPPQNIANKLLAELPVGVDPERLARAVRKAVADYWRDKIAAPVRNNCAGLLANNIDAVWTEQIDTFPDFTASWLPLINYAETRGELERTIAARKLLRDFSPWVHGRGNVRKSSLDGGRESVLAPREKRAAGKARQYRIEPSEDLDAVGLVKRAGGKPDQFVPVINVALASWVERASKAASPALQALIEACRVAGVSHINRPDLPCVKPFPFDGSILLPSRWCAVFKEQGLEDDAEKWGRQHVQPLFKKLREPFPYVACLVADGDRMGGAISELATKEPHHAPIIWRTFSKALAGFAAVARKIVEQQHRGALVYAGGDDVLAFVSLPKALSCANALRIAFEHSMAAACESLPTSKRPTLSVGLGVGHVMESMGNLLALGRQAEREAKRDRNALAVLVEKRSGGTRPWRAQWTSSPVQRVDEACALLRGRLSSRKVFDIERAIARLPKPDESNEDAWAHLLACEVTRELKRIEGGGLRPEDVGLSLDPATGYAKLHEQVVDWVNRLLIARTFDRAAPEPGSEEVSG